MKKILLGLSAISAVGTIALSSCSHAADFKAEAAKKLHTTYKLHQDKYDVNGLLEKLGLNSEARHDSLIQRNSETVEIKTWNNSATYCEDLEHQELNPVLFVWSKGKVHNLQELRDLSDSMQDLTCGLSEKVITGIGGTRVRTMATPGLPHTGIGMRKYFTFIVSSNYKEIYKEHQNTVALYEKKLLDFIHEVEHTRVITPDWRLSYADAMGLIRTELKKYDIDTDMISETIEILLAPLDKKEIETEV